MGVNPPFSTPHHLQSPPYCITSARPLRNIRPPTNLLRLCHTAYHIGDGNIVLRPMHHLAMQGLLPLETGLSLLYIYIYIYMHAYIYI